MGVESLLNLQDQVLDEIDFIHRARYERDLVELVNDGGYCRQEIIGLLIPMITKSQIINNPLHRISIKILIQHTQTRPLPFNNLEYKHKLHQSYS